MSTHDLGETVYAIFDAYDGPIEGVADYQGIPHYFWRVFDKTNDDWTAVFPEDRSAYEEAKQRLAILLEENPNPKFQREGRFIVSELRKRVHDSTSADGRFVKWRTNARIERVSERDQTEREAS
jgi:hypothetical protein